MIHSSPRVSESHVPIGNSIVFDTQSVTSAHVELYASFICPPWKSVALTQISTSVGLQGVLIGVEVGVGVFVGVEVGVGVLVIGVEVGVGVFVGVEVGVGVAVAVGVTVGMVVP